MFCILFFIVDGLQLEEIDTEETCSDCDDCDDVQLKQLFKKSYTVESEKALSLSTLYVLHLDHKR